MNIETTHIVNDEKAAGRAIPRSRLPDLLRPESFCWAAGIEDTFIATQDPRTGRTLDEYALTDHYARWRSDEALLAELGVRMARYGIPWHRVNPAPGQWDWDWAERSLEHLLELGIDPLVDLVHYGTPTWLAGAFLNPDFPARMAEYAARLADRFKGRIHWYTPLNEPRITAWYSGKLGWWPPFRRGWRGFVEVLLSVVRAIVETAHALLAVDPEIVLLHVDATDLYHTDDTSLKAEAERRQHIVLLPLDLVAGLVTREHPLYTWLLEKGAREDDLSWFQERGIGLDVVGLNLYPMYTNKVLVRSRRGIRIRMPYASAEIVDRLGALYGNHYRRPMMISETASAGPVPRRRRWLQDSVAAVRSLRSRGIPMIGYTWWPLFSLVAWAYRQGNKEMAEYLLNMGLWDVDPASMDRLATPLVQDYARLVSRGVESVGLLGSEESIGIG